MHDQMQHKALLIFQLNKMSRKWFIHKFIEEHSQELTSHKLIQLITINKEILGVDKAIRNSIVAYGIKLCNIKGLIVGCSSGYKHMGFHSKDMYNYICKVRKGVTTNEDVITTLNYLKEMGKNVLALLNKNFLF